MPRAASKPAEDTSAGAEAPAKRGRGRPRKLDSEKKTAAPKATGGKRGRPAGSSSSSGVKKTTSGRGRGRPRKADVSDSKKAALEAEVVKKSDATKATGTGKRGRPRKSDASASGKAVETKEDEEVEVAEEYGSDAAEEDEVELDQNEEDIDEEPEDED